MESKLSNNIELSLAILLHVKKSIEMLRVWNESIESEHDYYRSHSGMEHLSASCMLLEAIGEGIKQVEKKMGEQFFAQCPEIPWNEVKGLRNHIAHGYFDIDGAAIFETIKQDLDPLENAINRLITLIQQ